MSNEFIVKIRPFDKVECCFNIVAVFGNNVASFGNNVERNFVLRRNKWNMFNLFRLCRQDEISFDIVAKNGNNVEATFYIVERIVQLVAFDNIAWTLLLVWTGLKASFTPDELRCGIVRHVASFFAAYRKTPQRNATQRNVTHRIRCERALTDSGYLCLIDATENSVKYCAEDGNWFAKSGMEWTDYRPCVDKQVLRPANTTLRSTSYRQSEVISQ